MSFGSFFTKVGNVFNNPQKSLGISEPLHDAFNPWKAVTHPGDTFEHAKDMVGEQADVLKNTGAGVTNFIQDPSLQTFYGMAGTSTPFAPDPLAPKMNQASNGMKNQSAARANFDPYLTMPKSGDTLYGPQDNGQNMPISPWSIIGRQQQ